MHQEGSLDNQFGILFRFDENGNYYLFAASSDGYYTMQLFENDEWQAIIEWTETDAVVLGEGEVNTLGLLAEGDTYSLIINDSIIDEATDDTLTGTGLALNAAAFGEPPIDIAFDNFRLWYVGDPLEQAVIRGPVRGRDIPGTAEPTVTPEATEEATLEPTEEPTAETTPEPTEEPTAETTPEPTEEPTSQPTAEPTEEATAEPTATSVGTSSDPTIAAIQAQPPTYSTDFSSDPTDWVPFPSDAVVTGVIDGGLEFAFNSPNVLTWSELPLRPTSYYLEVDATVSSPVETAEYGIIFNYIDSQNFYLYAINNASRYSVWRLVDNAWETVHDWADAPVLLAGEDNTNRLGLLMQADSYWLVANDEVLAEIETSEAAAGSIAVAAGTFEEADLVMTFDNVLLWDLDEVDRIPTAEPTTEVEPTAEPTEEAVSQDFADINARIEEIVAAEPDIRDEFRRDSGTWDTQSHDFGDYYYESRVFNIEATAAERIVWSAYYENDVVEDAVQFDDFYAEFDTSFVTYTGENAAGLVFRLLDTENFYKFVVDEIGYFQVQKRVDGEYSDLIEWTISDAVDDTEGAVNRIGILAEGATLAFSVNGDVIVQVEDSDLASGAIALAIQSYSTPEAHSTFDNFDLWILNP